MFRDDFHETASYSTEMVKCSIQAASIVMENNGVLKNRHMKKNGLIGNHKNFSMDSNFKDNVQRIVTLVTMAIATGIMTGVSLAVK